MAATIDTKTVFLVDDDEFVRDSLSALLQAYHFKVEAFASGQDFLAEQARRTDSGCVLLDIHMPGLSGLDTLKTLRARNNDTPAILITGLRDRVIEMQAEALGAIALLDKPFPVGSLLAALRQALPC